MSGRKRAATEQIEKQEPQQKDSTIIMLATTPRLLLSLLCLLTAQWAYAAPKLNGMAIHNELGQEQFIAAVYAESLTSDARQLILGDEDKAMEIRILAETIFARRFNRMWIEGIAINAGSREMEKYAQDLANFSNMMRIKLRKGDILRINRSRGAGTSVAINGVPLGKIEDVAFFDLLLRTWVGPVPVSTDFKEALLNAGKVPEDLRQRFDNVQPSAERVAAINTAINRTRTAQAVSSEAASQSSPADQQPTSPASTVAQTSSKASSKPPVTVSVSSTPQRPSSPAATSQPTGLMSEEDLFEDEEIFDEEDEDFAFTAESLLSEQLYISKLTKWTGSYVKYPKFAIRNEQQGTVRLTVTLARNGKVLDVQYMEKSQYEQLNKAASRAVSNASPYPAVPDEIAGDTFVFTVPVVFRLQ